MIVKMKKVSLVLFDKYREESLKQLRELGVLHLEQIEGKGEEYEKLYALTGKLNHALTLLPVGISENPVEYLSIEDSLLRADEIAGETDRLKLISDRINALSKEIERIQPLGEFDPALAGQLADAELTVSLFSVNKSDASVFGANKAFKIAETKSRVYFACLGPVPEALDGFERFAMPSSGIVELKKEQQLARAEKSTVEKKLYDLTAYRSLLQKAAAEAEVELQFEVVHSGINVDEKLSYLTGFCPVPVMEELQKTAETEGWALLIVDPDEEDEVPTQLKLSKFASLLTPVTNFLGIIPGYREHDISFFFLCFFSVFTAMLIGDAGYGLIFFAITIVGIISFSARKKDIPQFFFLLLLLSVSTIIWGAVTGTWFASKSIMEIGFFQSLKLNAFKVGDNEQISLIMGISFFLGIFQMLIGVVQNFRKNFPKKKSFAQIGWFAILVAIYYLVLTLVVKRAGLETYPTEMLYVLLGGVAIVFLFGGQEEGQSFIKGILNSLGNFLQLFLDVVGTFSDIMSYVRLFAVGLASVKIAETFNQLGSQMSDGPIIIFGILIIIIGHSMNIVLGLMAVIVHAVRLNILEYSGKVGVEWSGFKYEPFQINKEN
ncbi:MAG: hypothetical protein JEZ04_02215 [Spirochaetales bacterium]|nr:hypothetical protein [Spirochaetales bacterium]